MAEQAKAGPGDIAVVHLALKSYGLEPFEAFLDSYRRHRVGCEHQLVIALKQFATEADAAAHLALLTDIPCTVMHVPDQGFDIGSYFLIARQLERRAFCFFNSRATICADDWLAKLRDALSPTVGLAGATGSLQSLSSDRLRPQYRRGRGSIWPPIRARLAFLRQLRHFPPFPNPHMRTNAFFIERETLLRIKLGRLDTKLDAMRFESGWNGLTRQLRRLDLTGVIVDAEGASYALEAAAQSETFWQGAQRRLLATDNQTERYQEADAGARAFLRRLAWTPPSGGDDMGQG